MKMINYNEFVKEQGLEDEDDENKLLGLI